MQNRFLGQKITMTDIEKLRSARELRSAIQNEMSLIEKGFLSDPQEIILQEERLKAVQKSLVRLEDYLFSIELGNR